MKKILFVLSVLAMMVVGCKNPTVPTETPVEETPTVEAPKEGGNTPETPPSNPPASTPTPEDKSPYEYVKPACVNLADYTYVGDYIFADTMNFAEWKYSSATDSSIEPYLLAFEKIARVKNDNPDTRIVRYNHNDPNTEVPVIKATKYKIYAKTTSVTGVSNGNAVIGIWFGNSEESYDGTRIRIIKVSDDAFTINVNGDSSEVMNDYQTF